MEDSFLPASVLGPVECRELARLISARFGVVMPWCSSGGSGECSGGSGRWLKLGELGAFIWGERSGDPLPYGRGSVAGWGSLRREDSARQGESSPCSTTQGCPRPSGLVLCRMLRAPGPPVC
jgi:hypothetical protein